MKNDIDYSLLKSVTATSGNQKVDIKGGVLCQIMDGTSIKRPMRLAPVDNLITKKIENYISSTLRETFTVQLRFSN